jgi:hypothetical protein
MDTSAVDFPPFTLHLEELKMKRLRLLFTMALLVGFASIACSQEKITPEDAAKFIGQQKTVCGTVASAHYAARSKGQPTFMNLNRPYLNQVFTGAGLGIGQGKVRKVAGDALLREENLRQRNDSELSGAFRNYCERPVAD